MVGLACATADERPNVLLILIDDQSDLVSSLGDNTVHTPNFDRLAARGTNFTRAYCAAPACGPSRASLLTGLLPSSTGDYYNSAAPIPAAETTNSRPITLPLHFKRSGYVTGIYGKVFHLHNQGAAISTFATEDMFSEHTGFWANLPDSLRPSLTDFRHEGGSNFAWGPVPDDWERPGRQLIDTENADHVIRQLQQSGDTPFLITLGFLRPHLPWVAPQRFFDLYPLESIELPAGFKAGDLEDLPDAARWMAREVPGQRHGDSYLHAAITAEDQWRHAIQAYRACTSHLDDQLGRVLDVLARSPHADNTIVVVTSDHGYHLGEKEHWTKFGLWEKTLRVPLIIALPDGQAKIAETPVSLVDLYPTLVGLTGIEPPNTHTFDGVDLSPILWNPTAPRGQPVISTYGRDNHSVRTADYRYIRYRDGTEELYAHPADHHEWTNLASDPTYAAVLKRHREMLPTHNEPEKNNGGGLGWENAFEPGFTYP